MAVTIKDVAALAGVSPSTVSRTCKNNPSISEETKERVRRAMTELGYEPNFQASNLATQNSRTIGIILPPSQKETFENAFFLEAIRSGMSDEDIIESFKAKFRKTSSSEVAPEKAVNLNFSIMIKVIKREFGL